MSAPAELGLSDTESLRAQRLKLEMDKIGLPGLSEEQCFGFKDAIAKLISLPEEQLLAFKDGIAKLKSRSPIWRALQERPTVKQKQKAISKCVDVRCGMPLRTPFRFGFSELLRIGVTSPVSKGAARNCERRTQT